VKWVNVSKIVGETLLAGSKLGRKHLPLLVSAALTGGKGETVVWDWSGVELATSSYFASTMAPLLRMAMAGEMEMYPVFLGLNTQSLEELKIVLEAERMPVFLAKRKTGPEFGGVTVIGKLDEAYLDTLREVLRKKEVSTRSLIMSDQNQRKVSQTAWINRLVRLNRLRLVRRKKIGREFVYKPSFLEA